MAILDVFNGACGEAGCSCGHRSDEYIGSAARLYSNEMKGSGR